MHIFTQWQKTDLKVALYKQNELLFLLLSCIGSKNLAFTKTSFADFMPLSFNHCMPMTVVITILLSNSSQGIFMLTKKLCPLDMFLKKIIKFNYNNIHIYIHIL